MKSEITKHKNQNIKNDSIKRKERIKIIDTEIESWKNLLENSDKSIKQLNERRQKSLSQLNLLENNFQTYIKRLHQYLNLKQLQVFQSIYQTKSQKKL